MREYIQVHVFYKPYFVLSCLISLFAGFGLAGHLSYVISFGYPIDASVALLMQSHGHAQLVGWTGLLLIGVSIHVMPKLYGIRSRSSNTVKFICWSMAFGVIMRCVTPLITTILNKWYGTETGVSPFYCWIFGAALELISFLLYLRVIVVCFFSKSAVHAEKKRLKPYFLAMILGWLTYLSGSLILIIVATIRGTMLLDGWWNSLLIDSFTRLTLVSAVLVFGIKMLPIFLGLRSPLWSVHALGLLYLSSTALHLISRALYVKVGFVSILFEVLSSLSLIFISIAIFWYMWELDIYQLRGVPGRIQEKLKRQDVVCHRGRMNDQGEYGHFEWFIFVGFGWLVLWSSAEATNAVLLLIGNEQLFSYSLLRHILLLGFIAHIIFGVGYRLLPKLLGKSLKSRFLVDITFVVLTVATVSRIMPELLMMIGIIVPPYFYGLSGSWSIIALLLFFSNIIFGRESTSE